MQKQLDKFKNYLLERLEEVEDIDIVELTPEIKAKQVSAGIKGCTHCMICKFEYGWHPISIDARKKTIKGWKAVVDFVNRSHEKMLKKIIQEQTINLNE